MTLVMIVVTGWEPRVGLWEVCSSRQSRGVQLHRATANSYLMKGITKHDSAAGLGVILLYQQQQ